MGKHHITLVCQPPYSPDLAPCNFRLFPELNLLFNFNKATKCASLTPLFIKHYKIHTHTLHHALLHFNTLQCSYTHYSSPMPDVLHCNTDTQYISCILPSSSIPFSTHLLQYIHQYTFIFTYIYIIYTSQKQCAIYSSNTYPSYTSMLFTYITYT